MSERPFSLRAKLFLYSNANIVGCSLAALGPVLLFLGVIQNFWLPITLGLYIAGYFLGGRTPEIERKIEESLTLEQTLVRLDTIIASAKRHLTPEMISHLESLRTSIVEVLPRLMNAGSGNADLFTVRETVLRYLPETLANYAALPPAFRISQQLKDGQTARQLLDGQLALLDSKMKEIVANVATSDAQALLANGKFLEMKFKQPDFLAG